MVNSDRPVFSLNEQAFLQGGGEMGAAMRAKDWSKTSLGAPETWPQSLRTMVSVMLDNPFGMYIAWGSEYIQLYNDGYRPILGDSKHPAALGISTRKTFSEIWHIIGMMFDGVMKGNAVGFSDFMLPLNRNGFVEECYFDFSYSPIRKENGEVGGLLVTIIETTNKKKAEDNLKESKDQLQFAIEAAELATWDYSPVTNKFSSNERLKEWFGLNEEHQIDLQQAINSISPKDQDRVANEIQKAILYCPNSKYDIEFTIIHPLTCRERIVSAKGKAWFDTNNVCHRLNGTVQDITEQAEAKIKLEKKEEQLRIALEGGELGTFDYFPNDDKLLWSEKTKEFFGLAPEAAVNIDIYMQALHPDDRDSSNALAQRQLILQNGGLYDLEYRTIGIKDGRIRWIRSTGKVTYDSNDNPIRYTGIIQDITKHKETLRALVESEERFRAIADNISQLAWMSDEKGQMVWVNKRWLQYTGKSLKQMVKVGADSIYHPDHRDRVVDKYLKAIKGGKEWEDTFPLLGADGKYRWFLSRAITIKNADGKVIQWFGTDTDITERMDAEEQLLKSQQQMQSMVGTAPFPIGVYIGSDMIIQFANKSILDIWGKGNDVIGKSYKKVLPELDNQEIFKQLATVFETGVSYHATNVKIAIVTDRKTTIFYFNYSFTPLLDADGKIYGVMNTAADVTDLNLAKLAIQKSEANLRSTILQAPVAMCIFKGGNFIVELANDRMFEFWGKPAKEVMHKPIFEGLPEVTDQGFETILREVYNTGKTFSADGVPVTLPRRGGIEQVYVNFVYEPYREADGTISGILAVAIDVTAQLTASKKIEEREQKFRLLADSIPQLIWTGDANGHLNYFNQSVYNFSGLKEDEVTKEGGWLQIVHPDEKDENIKQWLNSVRTGTDFKFEHRFRRYDGEYRWQLSRAVPQRDAEGKVQMWVGTSTDIQEIKEHDQQKDDFISIASHEMKTPLTTARGYIELLQMVLNEEDQTAFLYANKANQAVERLHSLVTELLDASKIQNGQLNYNISTFDFNQMMEETIENMQHTTQTHGIQKTGTSSQLVTGDKERLQQVLLNLLSNAIKYSPKADKIIIKVAEQPGNIQVSIQDFGIGMAEEHVEKIFNRYYRVKEQAIHFQGLGIGLFLSSNIILRHNGKLWAESEPEKGSTFYFTIPII